MRKSKLKKQIRNEKPYCPDGITRYKNRTEYLKQKREKADG